MIYLILYTVQICFARYLNSNVITKFVLILKFKFYKNIYVNCVGVKNEIYDCVVLLSTMPRFSESNDRVSKEINSSVYRSSIMLFI